MKACHFKSPFSMAGSILLAMDNIRDRCQFKKNHRAFVIQQFLEQAKALCLAASVDTGVPD